MYNKSYTEIAGKYPENKRVIVKAFDTISDYTNIIINDFELSVFGIKPIIRLLQNDEYLLDYLDKKGIHIDSNNSHMFEDDFLSTTYKKAEQLYISNSNPKSDFILIFNSVLDELSNKYSNSNDNDNEIPTSTILVMKRVIFRFLVSNKLKLRNKNNIVTFKVNNDYVKNIDDVMMPFVYSKSLTSILKL